MIREVLNVAIIGGFLILAGGQNSDAANTVTPKGPPPAEFYPFEAKPGDDVINDKVRLAPMQDGQRLFNRRCGVCHLGGGMGTGVLARRLDPQQALLQNRTGLTEEYVISVARSGMGAMPRISRVDVTDAELKAIARHLAKVKP